MPLPGDEPYIGFNNATPSLHRIGITRVFTPVRTTLDMIQTKICIFDFAFIKKRFSFNSLHPKIIPSALSGLF
jgi:hypothetical protein